MKNQEESYIYGRNPVIEAIRNDAPIEKIYIQFGIDEKFRNDIIIKAKRKKINCSQIDKQKFFALEREITGKNNVSQGIIAIKGTVKYLTLDELISNSFETTKNPVIVLLDEINDPHNLGAIARTAECSGAAGVIVTERNSAPITPTAIKASAGALEYLPVAKQSSVIQTIEKLKEKELKEAQRQAQQILLENEKLIEQNYAQAFLDAEKKAEEIKKRILKEAEGEVEKILKAYHEQAEALQKEISQRIPQVVHYLSEKVWQEYGD